MADDPIQLIMQRIRDAAPNAPGVSEFTSQVQAAVEGVFEQLQLVPRRELDTHLARLERLEQLVASLEKRLEELEG